MLRIRQIVKSPYLTLTLFLAFLATLTIATARSQNPVAEICWTILESSFMPHGHCYLWQPGLLWTHVSSDALIAISYFTIPISLIYFIKRRPNLRFRGMFILFGAFICLCGLTHVISVYNVWNGAYWLSALIKAATAVASVATAIVLAKSLPVALSIPLPDEYKKVTDKLQKESEGRKVAQEQLYARVSKDTQKLWESDSRWKLLSDFIYSAVWVTNTEGEVTHQLPSFEKLTGLSFEQCHGFGWLQAYLESDREALKTEWLRCIKDGTTYEFEAQLWSEERKCHIPVAIKGIPIKDDNGKILEWIGAIYDLSEIKKQEITLASYSRRLEAQNKYLKEFANAASHDLREPLRKINAYGDVLKEDFFSDLPEDAGDCINAMQSAAQRMSVLVDDLLDYSTTSSFEVNAETFDLGRLLDRVESDLEVSVKENSATIERENIGYIKADEHQFQRVVQNIVSNALKYHKMDEPAKLKISSRIVSKNDFSSKKFKLSKEHYHEIRFEDQGIGFDEAYADRILKPFERLHSRSEFPGTGIGLAICHRIIERHGGFLLAESKKDVGSVFTVYLPAESKSI